jgi:uracil-DNA glycosylase
VSDKGLILDTISTEIRSCSKCGLSVTRTNAVPGIGSYETEIMFVGEGPGANEDLQGEPFVGAAGQLLDKLLGMIGLVRTTVFITNIVKCRPPQNRTPQPDEIKTCKPYLDAQIALIHPKIIVTLGSPSTATLLGRQVSMGAVHGKMEVRDGIRFFPTYHPAAYLHKRAPELLEQMKNDFRQLKAILAEIG